MLVNIIISTSRPQVFINEKRTWPNHYNIQESNIKRWYFLNFSSILFSIILLKNENYLVFFFYLWLESYCLFTVVRLFVKLLFPALNLLHSMIHGKSRTSILSLRGSNTLKIFCEPHCRQTVSKTKCPLANSPRD
jgi:hypothetical protein